VISNIAEDSPEAAARVLEVVLGAAESLDRLSERGRVVPELGDRVIREIFVYSYRLLYQISEEEVRILGILHGARDFQLWRRDLGAGGEL
jgi:plasmid stabilization system protein ParE